jgi:hypothetical protein
MKVMRYVNLYETVQDGDEVYEIPYKMNITLPIILNPYKITTIEPFYSKIGREYKNVSIISYETGEKFKVVGNYVTIDDSMHKVETSPIGFNNGKQIKEEIEDRTKIKSTVK